MFKDVKFLLLELTVLSALGLYAISSLCRPICLHYHETVNRKPIGLTAIVGLDFVVKSRQCFNSFWRLLFIPAQFVSDLRKFKSMMASG